MGITEKVVAELNDYLAKQYDFRVKFEPREWSDTEEGVGVLVLASSRGFRCPYINLDDSAQADMEDFLLRTFGIKLHYNNTGSTFWAEKSR